MNEFRRKIKNMTDKEFDAMMARMEESGNKAMVKAVNDFVRERTRSRDDE